MQTTATCIWDASLESSEVISSVTRILSLLSSRHRIGAAMESRIMSLYPLSATSFGKDLRHSIRELTSRAVAIPNLFSKLGSSHKSFDCDKRSGDERSGVR